MSAKNQKIFDQVKHVFGAVPDLYATLAYSENALEAYFRLENSKTSLSAKEVEAVGLIVSGMDNYSYSPGAGCSAEVPGMASRSGFTEEQAVGIRNGNAGFDAKLNVLVKLTKQLSEKRQIENKDLTDAFFDAGYTKENLMDIIILIGNRMIGNILRAVNPIAGKS